MKQKLLINEAKNLVLFIRYLSISQKSRKTNELVVDQWCLQQKGGKEVTAEREEGSHRAKPFRRGFQKFGTAPIFQKQNDD